MKDIIIVNQYFDPLPTDGEILEDNVSSSTLASKVIGELIKSSLAHESSFGLNYFGNDVKLAFKTVGRSFKSLGSPGVQTDTRGISISDRLRLFNNKIYLNLAYDSFQDNVNNRKPEDETLHRNTISGGVSYYTPDYLPNISFNTRQYGRENSAGYTYVTLPDGSQDSTGNPVGDQTATNTISLDQAFSFFGAKHNTGLSYNISASEDDYNPGAQSGMTSLSLRMASKYEWNLETNISYSSTVQTSLNKANELNYNKFSASSRYMLLPSKLWLSGGLNLTMASGGNDQVNAAPTDPAGNDATVRSANVDYSRAQLRVGSVYRPAKNHKLKLSAYKVFHEDEGYTEFWSARQAKNKDGTNFIKQDDFVTKLGYTYKF